MRQRPGLEIHKEATLFLGRLRRRRLDASHARGIHGDRFCQPDMQSRFDRRLRLLRMKIRRGENRDDVDSSSLDHFLTTIQPGEPAVRRNLEFLPLHVHLALEVIGQSDNLEAPVLQRHFADTA